MGDSEEMLRQTCRNGLVRLEDCNSAFGSQWYFTGGQMISSLCWSAGVSTYLTVFIDGMNRCDSMLSVWGNPQDAIVRADTFMFVDRLPVLSFPGWGENDDDDDDDDDDHIHSDSPTQAATTTTPLPTSAATTSASNDSTEGLTVTQVPYLTPTFSPITNFELLPTTLPTISTSDGVSPTSPPQSSSTIALPSGE
ncbi:hypothetical protein ACHAXS_000954 [Conticribra weissflogii]